MSLGEFFKNFTEGFKSIVDTAENRFHDRVRAIESRIMKVFFRIRRKVYKSVFEILFFSISIVFLFIGLALFLSRYFPLDLVVIGFALFALYIGLILRMTK